MTSQKTGKDKHINVYLDAVFNNNEKEKWVQKN